MAENKKILAVHKSREVLLDILTVRGFNTEDYKGFSISEIHALLVNKQLDILLKSGENDSGKKVYIKFYLEKTLRPSNVHDFIDDLFNIEQILSKEDDLVIIIKDQPNDTLEKLQSSIYEHDGIFVTIINIDRLQFNILNHSLVPKHRTLSDTEMEEIKNKYNVTDNSNFPEISRFDPVSQVIGIKPNDICEIIRPSKNVIQTKYYRACVNY